MISFAVYCTNCRNGGQNELLIEAENASEAEQHVLATRPYFRIEKTWAIERKFVVYGMDRHNRHDALSYLAPSAEHARARCQELNPEFAIDRVEADNEWNRQYC